jgi:hypothetical protein
MALPLPNSRSANLQAVSPKFAEYAFDIVQRFTREQQRLPVVLVIGYDPFLLRLPAQRVLMCDPNAPAGADVLPCHSVRIGAGLEVDVVILNVFQSTTLNRWAPVYIIRDLLRRRILRTFATGNYVYPSRGTMSLRLYEYPTCEDPVPANRITWRTGAPMYNTDLLVPYGQRVDVLYEQYDQPAQTWPSVLSFQTTKPHAYPLVAVLEWSVQVHPTQTHDHLAMRRLKDVQQACRLLRPGMTYFVWPSEFVDVQLTNAPKITTGGITLALLAERRTPEEVSLSILKMDTAIERWFGSIVSMQISF